MKNFKKALLICLTAGFASTSHASDDIREQFVVQNPHIKSILKSFKKYNQLQCSIATEESGEKSIRFYEENYISRYTVNYLCDDGRSLSFDGIFGDGGLTVEKVELLIAN